MPSCYLSAEWFRKLRNNHRFADSHPCQIQKFCSQRPMLLQFFVTKLSNRAFSINFICVYVHFTDVTHSSSLPRQWTQNEVTITTHFINVLSSPLRRDSEIFSSMLLLGASKGTSSVFTNRLFIFLYPSPIRVVCYTSIRLEQYLIAAFLKNLLTLPRKQFSEIPKQQLLRWKNFQKRKIGKMSLSLHTMKRPNVSPCYVQDSGRQNSGSD